MRLFDTHAHLSDPQILNDLDSVLLRAREVGIQGIVAIGTDPRSSDMCARIANDHEMVYAAAGYQPNNCHTVTKDGWKVICELAKQSKVVAIGETGLDRYWDDCPFQIQQEWFDRHIELSMSSGKPLVIHMRECEQDIVESLQKYDSPVHGIMHSYTGSLDSLSKLLELGLYISFAGMVTFKKSEALREVAKQVPLERLLIETDAPYLSPHPMRKQRPNEPALVKHTADCLAEVFGMDMHELANITTENALRVFGLGNILDE